MPDSYSALTTISKLYKGLAVLVFAAVILATLGRIPNLANMVFVLLSGSILALGVYASGEFISLLVEVVLNTRQMAADTRITNKRLQQQIDLLQQQLQLQHYAAREKPANSSQ